MVTIGHSRGFSAAGSSAEVDGRPVLGRPPPRSQLAGGDHLHFTMLVNGRPVNPVEWWDPHWVQDRVDRKLRTVGASTSTGGR